jgi:hypothetical protein
MRSRTEKVLLAIPFLSSGIPEFVIADLNKGVSHRNEAIAEELETAALRLSEPPAGMTGFAPWYFAPVFDLLGGCAEPFFRRFLSSPSAELRTAAQRWLALLADKKLMCGR